MTAVWSLVNAYTEQRVSNKLHPHSARKEINKERRKEESKRVRKENKETNREDYVIFEVLTAVVMKS
jgi:hypothetical protein